MTKFYQWILKNNQEPHYNLFVVTDKYYPTEESVREWCCIEHLYSLVSRIDESEIDLDEAPYLSHCCVQTLPESESDDYFELKAHAEGWYG